MMNACKIEMFLDLRALIELCKWPTLSVPHLISILVKWRSHRDHNALPGGQPEWPAILQKAHTHVGTKTFHEIKQGTGIFIVLQRGNSNGLTTSRHSFHTEWRSFSPLSRGWLGEWWLVASSRLPRHHYNTIVKENEKDQTTRHYRITVVPLIKNTHILQW